MHVVSFTKKEAKIPYAQRARLVSPLRVGTRPQGTGSGLQRVLHLPAAPPCQSGTTHFGDSARTTAEEKQSAPTQAGTQPSRGPGVLLHRDADRSFLSS